MDLDEHPEGILTSTASIPGLVVRNARGKGFPILWVIAGLAGLLLAASVLSLALLPQRWGYLLMLAVLFAVVALLVGSVRKLLLAVIILDIPFQLDTHLDYHLEAAELGAFGGFNLSVTTGALTVLCALWLSQLLARRGPLSSFGFRASLPLGLYLVAVALSFVVARDLILASFTFLLLLQMFLLHLYIASTVRTRQDVLFLVKLLITALLLESLIMLLVYVSGQDVSFVGVSTSIDPVFAPRLGGTLQTPNGAASFLSLLLAPAVSLLLTQVGRRQSWLAAPAFGLGTVALVLTFSRGGWLAFSLSVAILFLLAWRRGWLPPVLPLAIFIGALVVAGFFQDAISTRFFGYGEVQAAQSRIHLMKLAFHMIEDQPLWGVGANNFATMIKEYVTPEFSREWLYVVHNTYLLIWAEVGIGGLVAFLLFLVGTVFQGWRCWRLRDPLLSPLALGLTAAIIGHMAHMLVDVFNMRPQIQLLWLMAGLVAAISHITSEVHLSEAGSAG
jgi:O-antigen ligase